MNTETDYLKTIAEEIASARKLNAPEINKANKYLETEAKRLEKAVMLHLNEIKNHVLYDTFYLNVMNKLVHICDILFDAGEMISADVLVIIELLTSLKALVPEDVTVNVRLPRAFIVLQGERLTNSWKQYSETMEKHGVHAQLITIAGIPFKKFTDRSDNLCWRDLSWLKGYMAKLDIVEWEHTDCNSHTEALMSLLIGRDFNDDRFYIYCKKYIDQRTAKAGGKHKRILEFAACEKIILQDTQIGMPPYDPGANTLSSRLIKWIGEEIAFIRAHEQDPPYTKLHFHLPNYKIAFLFKLFSEHKIFGDTPFKELARQIAGTCLSLDGAEILPQTMVSKAYPKDQGTLVEMETLLVNMLAYVRRFIRKN